MTASAARTSSIETSATGLTRQSTPSTVRTPVAIASASRSVFPVREWYVTNTCMLYSFSWWAFETARRPAS
jgi:hypothetical protein